MLFPKRFSRLSSEFLVQSIKRLLVIFPIAFFVWLLNQNFILGSSLTYHYRPSQWSNLILLDNPRQVVASLEGKEKLLWRVAANQLSFTSFMPRVVDQVRVQITLANASTPIITLAASGSSSAGTLQTIEHFAFLNQLTWKRVTDGRLSLWQRAEKIKTLEPVKQYDSVENFLADPPDAATIAVFNIDQRASFRPPAYRPSNERRNLGHTFRGSHNLYAYVQNEDLQLHLEKVDLNRQDGPDPLTISIYRADEPQTTSRQYIYQRKLGDDGNTSENGQSQDAHKLDIKISDVPAGVYIIKLEASQDVLLKELETTGQYLAFQSHIFLAEGPEYQSDSKPVALRVDSRSIKIQAMHAEGLQTIISGTKKINLDVVKKPFEVPSPPERIIKLETGDVNIEGPGLLTFENFLPWDETTARRLPQSSEPDVESVDYILASYKPNPDGMKILIDRTYDIRDLTITNRRLSFSLGFPGLANEEEYPELHGISVSLIRQVPGWKKAVQKVFSSRQP